MNVIISSMGGHPATMSSREIAQLCDKDHRNVARDIRKMLEALHVAGGVLKFERTYTSEQNGQEYREFLLPKRECLVLVSGYSTEIRARIIDRWMELEDSHRVVTTPNLNDPSLLRHLLLENVEKVLALESKVSEMQTAVEALDQIAEAHGSMSRTEAAKHLGVPPHVLIKWMKMNGWAYRRPGSKEDLAYQSKIIAGYLEHKVTTGPRPDGTEWISTQLRVTAKGLTVLAKAFPASARAA